MGDHQLIRRRDAAQATLDRFGDKPFAWGSYDCGKMVAYHLRRMGHSVRLGGNGTYKTPMGAKRALRALGWPSLSAALDKRFERIAGASAIVGDLMAMPSEGDLDALAIVLGNGRVLGFHEAIATATVLQPVRMLHAWRIPT